MRLGGAVLALSLLGAAACSDEDDDTGTETEGTSAGGTTGTSAAGGGAETGGGSVDGTLAYGTVMPLTGALAPFGPGMETAVQLAVDDINAAGGVLGNDVTIVKTDDGTNPDVAGASIDGLINTDNVDAIFGPAASGVTLATLDKVVGAGRTQCSGSATSVLLSTVEDDGLYFRTAPSDYLQSKVLSGVVAGDGNANVAIVYRNDEYGEEFSKTLASDLEASLGAAPETFAYDPESTDFANDVTAVKDAAPDSVILIAFPEDGALVLAEMVKQGVGPADLPIYVTDGLQDNTLGETVDPNNPGVVASIKGTAPAAPENEEFSARMTEAGAEKVTFAAQFYDCAILMGLAAVAAESDDPALIAQNMVDVSTGGTECATFEECLGLLEEGEDIDYTGLTGIDFDDNGEPKKGVYDVWEFGGDGTYTALSTETVESD